MCMYQHLACFHNERACAIESRTLAYCACTFPLVTDFWIRSSDKEVLLIF